MDARVLTRRRGDDVITLFQGLGKVVGDKILAPLHRQGIGIWKRRLVEITRWFCAGVRLRLYLLQATGGHPEEDLRVLPYPGRSGHKIWGQIIIISSTFLMITMVYSLYVNDDALNSKGKTTVPGNRWGPRGVHKQGVCFVANLENEKHSIWPPTQMDPLTLTKLLFGPSSHLLVVW